MSPTPLLLSALVACTNSGLQDLSGLPALEDDGEVIEGQFIIGAEIPETLAAELGLALIERDDQGAGLYEALDADLWTLQTALKQKIDLSVQVEPNRPRATMFVANDPYRPLQWHLDVLDIDTAWDLARGAGVMVAVVDTGVWLRGQDTPRNVAAGWDFIGNGGNGDDGNGHGTHVAGTVAQNTHNAVGASGVAPEATILPVRVLDSRGSGTSWTVAQGIDFATQAGADVINLSLGSPSSTSYERDAVDRAIAAGVVVVAATGNDGRNTVSYPAAYPGVVGVGASRFDGSVTSYSNGGTGTYLIAPGGDVYRDQNGDGYGDGVLQETITGYELYQGTSMASPHVAGVAALLLSAGADPADVPDLLTSTASNGGRWDTRSGYGLVDPVAALQALGVGGGGGGGGTAPPPGPGPDVTAPTISNIGGWRSGTSLTLTWTTDEPSITAVSFDGYGRFEATGGLKTQHEMRFTVSRWETYWFQVEAEDAAGNASTSSTWVTTP